MTSTKQLLAAALLAGIVLGCGCSEDDPVATTPRAGFNGSGTAPAANLVRLTGTTIDNDTVRLAVVINGPTSSNDLYSWAFDLLFSDASVATLVPASEASGGALQPDPAQNQTVTTVVTQQTGRIVVGVSLTGGGTGHGLPTGEQTIVSFDMTVVSGGSTVAIVGSPQAGAPAALDSAGNVVASVTFDSAPSAIGK